MNLLIISHTAHILKEGKYFGWGPTIEEINFLTSKFDQITHIAPVENADTITKVPASFLELNSTVRMVPVSNRGGATLKAKLKVLVDSLEYMKVIRREMKASTGIIHVRCPSNISLVALFMLIFFPGRKKWIKYAGDWQHKHLGISNWLQRIVIQHFLRNHVATINGSDRKEKAFIVQIVNPSFRLLDITEVSQAEISKKCEGTPLSLLFVGSLEQFKRPEIVVETVALLIQKYPCKLVMVGGGKQLEPLKNLVSGLQLADHVEFVGWKSRPELVAYYKQAQFILLPSMGEGWPKVISEGMAYGVIPIVSDVSNLKSVLGSGGIGKVIPEYSAELYAAAIRDYLDNRERWKLESIDAREFAKSFSFEVWWDKLNGYLFDIVKVELT